MLEVINTILYYPFLNLITFFIWLVPGHNAAWGIILLTLLVRVLLIIPSKRAAQAQRRLQEMQPLIDELRAEYADDRQALAVAQMELYKKNNINPFGACVPALIQFPILIILYHTIINGLTANNPHLYSWVPQAEHINTVFLGLNLLKPDTSYILPILAAALQFFQMRMTMPKPVQKPGVQPDPAQAAQRQMMYIFPLITLIIAKNFPAGAALYWVVTTMFSIVQQHYVNKEKLKLSGVKEIVAEVERKHPEHKAEAEKVLKDMKEYVEEDKSVKKGVTVTVRKKK